MASFSEPASTRSLYPIVSARMKPRSKSVWITPAACAQQHSTIMRAHGHGVVRWRGRDAIGEKI